MPNEYLAAPEMMGLFLDDPASRGMKDVGLYLWPTPRNASTFREKFFAMGRAYVRFGKSNPALYRLMFSAGAGKAVGVHLRERGLAAFNVLIELMQSGQAEGVLRKRDARQQATAFWAQAHGTAMLIIDGLFTTEKSGSKALDAALTTLLEGLEN